jgi:uncharacterized phage protein gp47/JayE
MPLGTYQLGSNQLGTAATSSGGSGVTGTTPTDIQALVETVDVNGERLRDALNRETPIHTDPETDLANLLEAIGGDLDRIDDARETILQLRHVDTAIGTDLEKLGALVGVTRRDGETDPQLRQRIKVRGYAESHSGTTNQMMKLSALAFETDVESLGFPIDLATTPATFQVSVNQQIVDDAALGVATVENELENAVPAGHRVRIDVIASTVTTFDATLDAGLT